MTDMTFQDAETDSENQSLDRALPAIARLGASLDGEREVLRLALHSGNLADALAELGRAIAEQRERLDAIDLIAPSRWGAEQFHSRIISWLLDPSAHHQQAERFIAALLKAANAPQETLDADWSAAQVFPEWKNVVKGQVGYLDILVLNRDCRSLIAIENKIAAPEGRNQLTRYRHALANAYPDFDRRHIFLSPEGRLPDAKRDRKHWQPVRYSVIHNAIQRILETGGVADPDANALLQIYATSIRRKFMPDANLDQHARRIYLEHRDAIELIVANKPNWRDETKPMLSEAIAKHPCWKLDYEDSWQVRFRAAEWDRFPSSKTGIGWLPNSDALLLFQLRFGYPQSGVYMPYLDLGLSTGNAENSKIRKILFDAVRQNPTVFKPTSTSFSDDWMILHQEPDYILEPDDYGLGWDDGAARRKIEDWIDKFAAEQFPEMNRIIVDCLKRLDGV